MIAYRFADVAGLLNFIYGLSQWIYVQPDADVREKLIETLISTEPHVTPESMVPIYLRMPDESASWPITPSAADGAEEVSTFPMGLVPLSWTNIALLLGLEPTAEALNRDDLIFIVQGQRGDLLDMLDAIFELEHTDTLDVVMAPVNPETLGNLRSTLVENGGSHPTPGWAANAPTEPDRPVASLIKVSGLRRFYLLDKTATDPHLRVFYRHIFPQAAAVPPNLQLYVEWGYRYLLPPASFIMESWQRDKVGLVLLPAPGNGDPLMVSSSIAFRSVLQVSRSVRLVDSTGIKQLEAVTARSESRTLDLRMRLKHRPPTDVRKDEHALRHQIQKDLTRLERILARAREGKARRLYLYADDNPLDMDRLRMFILNNPLVLLNEFGYFCGRFHNTIYHMVLLPVEDGTNVVTADRFPDPPDQLQVFRRDPAWAAPGYELYIPREMELFPSLAPGLDNREDILRQVLGMTPDFDYETSTVMVMLYPDADGKIVNYHVPLTAEAGFVPLGNVGQSINTHVLTPETVQAVSIQVFENLGEALKPENISQDVLQLREQVLATYRSSWDVVRWELDKLLKRGLEAQKAADAARDRIQEMQKIDYTQVAEWQDLLSQVTELADKIEVNANQRGAEFQQRQDALLGKLHSHVDKHYAQQLQSTLDAISKAVHAPDFSAKHAEIATMLEALAAEMRNATT